MRDDWATGDDLRMSFPAHPDALRSGGTAFLTGAFRAFGTLGGHESVSHISRFEKVSGGSTGKKLLLDVEYDRTGSGLPTELFVKFSRDFDNPVRDHARTQMDAEVRFARLSSAPGFPIVVPRTLFADYCRAIGTGILVTERIPFGQSGIEPHYEKCLDDEIPDAIGHYRALITALGRLAGAHRCGALPHDPASHFPVDLRAAAVGEPKPLEAERLSRQLSRLAEFAATYPGLLPANVRSPQFLDRMGRQARDVMRSEPAIWHRLAAQPEYIGLCHWNANIDNAWFWRTSEGALQCGLMDWGCVSQINLAMAVWGCLSGAETALWDQYLDELLLLLCSEVRQFGGPKLDPVVLESHLQAYVALMGITWLLHVPALIQKRLPVADPLITPKDPRIRDVETLRAPLLMLTNALNLWETRRLDQALDGL